jgi:hypothetical protein
VSAIDEKYQSDWDTQWSNVSNGDLKAIHDLDMRALMIGYEFDGILKDELVSPPVFTVILIDSSRSEILFKSDTLQGAVELASDRLALLSGMTDL